MKVCMVDAPILRCSWKDPIVRSAAGFVGQKE